MIELAEATIDVEAPPDQVFDLFTTERGLCAWMATSAAIDLRPGGAWRWVHDNGVASSGEYLVVEPPERLSFTYGWESGPYADMAPGSTRVDVTFTPTPTGTRVVVAHGVVPATFRDAHLGGWTYFLGLLAEVAAGRCAPARRLPSTDGDSSVPAPTDDEPTDDRPSEEDRHGDDG